MVATGETQNPDRWTRERIKAALREAGYSLRALSRAHGKHLAYFSHVLVSPNPKAEAILAEILGLPAQEIWPERYGSDGLPHVGRFTPGRDLPAPARLRQGEAAQ